MNKKSKEGPLRVGVTHPWTRGRRSRCGLPDKCHWYTCPRSQCCNEFHPGPWVPAPRPSYVRVRDTWVRRGQWDHCIVEATRSNAPDTGHHCRPSTAEPWNPLHREGSPRDRERAPRTSPSEMGQRKAGHIHQSPTWPGDAVTSFLHFLFLIQN